MYSFRHLLLPDVPLYICRVRVHFPIVHLIETELAKRGQWDIPGAADATHILHP